ncbi:MAG: branched-chain amino acid transport system II carrier protein [Deltaproteobacteria bacterium]|jgi:LIVCS family branched-chain amino acid:cation transporter|nr:branched-chain amino acid transport system II carrier protein [Deltaproteobacteria bacterium]
MKQLGLHSLIVGAALFSMFFGAGNIIFPPYVGLAAGPEWFPSFLCYYLADIGLALAAILAMLRTQSIDKVEGVMVRLGAVPARAMMILVVVCLCPLLGIPRTCATTYAIAVAPLVQSGAVWPSVLFTVFFFGATLAFSIRESALVGLLGKFLTPLLIFGLLLLIILGSVSPIAPISAAPKIQNVVWMSVSAGYQTMDVLAAIVFGLLVVNALKARGFHKPRQQFLSVGLAGLVAGFFLFIVYCGLCHLGATVSSLYPENVDKGQLVLSISRHIFGPAGTAVLGAIIGLACLTTAIALTGSLGLFFNTLSKGKWPYEIVVIFCCLFSAVVANFGLSRIISLAAPILTVVYPGVLAVIALSLFGAGIKNDNVFRLAAAGAMIVSLGEVLGWYWPETFAFILWLPFQAPGFGWVIPSAVCACLGLLFRRKAA